MKSTLIKIIFSISLIFLPKIKAQQSLPLTNGTSTNGISKTIIEPKSNSNRYYYSNGSIKEIRETSNNKLHGTWKLFYDNGQLKKEGVFNNDKIHGQWKIYDQKGRLIFIENYNNGDEDGIWKAFYSNGKTKIEGTFIKGKRQGAWKTYSEFGELRKIITFEDDIEKRELILDDKSKDLNFFSINQSIGNY